jgi:hypothetical protein
MLFDTVLPLECQENSLQNRPGFNRILRLETGRNCLEIEAVPLPPEQNPFQPGSKEATMIPGFEALVEERIKKAQREGAFDQLPGSGKPIVFDEPNVPEELRMAHKILKNAGFLPPEVEVRKQITQTQSLLDSMETPGPEKTKARKKLNYLLTKLDTLRGESCVSALTRDQYRSHIIKKLS